MNLYLDASVLVALFSNDLFTKRADRALRGRDAGVLVSDFAATEFASSISRHVRMKELSVKDARDAFSAFDGWLAKSAMRVDALSEDVKFAESALRRLDVNLRAPDAIHIAIAQRLNAQLVTFDERMADCARMLGAPVFAA